MQNLPIMSITQATIETPQKEPSRKMPQLPGKVMRYEDMIKDLLPIPPPPEDDKTPTAGPMQKSVDRTRIQNMPRTSNTQSVEKECMHEPSAEKPVQPQHAALSESESHREPQDQASQDGESKPATTMMITNIPCRFGQEAICDAIHSVGFESKYDFVHIPRRNTTHDGNIGYAFVNFTDPNVAEAFKEAFDNYQFTGSKSNKRCEVKQAHYQGFNPKMDGKSDEKMRSRGKRLNQPRDQMQMMQPPLVQVQ
jgi:hypothetical protein